MRLIQLVHVGIERRVCLVDGDLLRFIATHTSVLALANAALAAGQPLAALAGRLVTDETVDYDDVYNGRSPWSVLPAADHPDEPARCLISGTGLTHRRSADQRQAMHAAGDTPTDSIRMYLWGEEGGRPAPGTIGTSPEWFYKGTGTTLRGHNEPGGGFVGGLIAAAAFSLYAISFGVQRAREAVLVSPLTLLGTGLLVALLSGLPGVLQGRPFLSALWTTGPAAVGTPALFDIGVFMVVAGVVLMMIFSLAEEA